MTENSLKGVFENIVEEEKCRHSPQNIKGKGISEIWTDGNLDVEVKRKKKEKKK